MVLLASNSNPSHAAASANAGAIPGTNTMIVNSINFGNIIEGGGDGNAPGLNLSIDLTPQILDAVNSVTLTLKGPDGFLVISNANVDDGDDLESLFFELSAQALSGSYEVYSLDIDFLGDPAITGLPEDGFTIGADEISSLMSSRFIELTNIDEDTTAPLLTELSLPTRSIVIDNDLPDILGGGDSVEITFSANTSDENSGLNVVEFEFDIGEGSPAVIGASIGLFGDLSNGVKQHSTFNTEAPAGTYILELLRVSDDQGNSLVYSADDLASLGFQNSVHVVTQADLQDATSPTVSALALAANEVTIGNGGGSLNVNLSATDTGFGATGVQTLSIVLVNASGSRYQLEANVVFSAGEEATASFLFPSDFPAGLFTIQRLSVNDGAYNRQDVVLDETELNIVNPHGGDITNNRLVGDAADNIIVARTGADTVIGGDGADHIRLGDGNDISYAGAGDMGDDTVTGGSGNDLIGGAAGDDLIIGGQLVMLDDQTLLFRSLEKALDGSDTLYGGAGDDTIYGGSPRLDLETSSLIADSDFGSVAPDVIYAGSGNDFVQGSYGSDEIGGGTGADTVNGGAGNDIIYGGAGDAGAIGPNDVISGETGNDIIFASGGNDNVSGGADNDTLFGGAGDDTITADGGHDKIYGGTGDDILTGGTGADVFYFRPSSGADTITDYTPGEDKLVLTQYADRFNSLGEILASAEVTTQNGDAGLLLNLGDGDQIFLVDVFSTTELTVGF